MGIAAHYGDHAKALTSYDGYDLVLRWATCAYLGRYTGVARCTPLAAGGLAAMHQNGVPQVALGHQDQPERSAQYAQPHAQRG